MTMPRRIKTGKVIVSNHAYARYIERVGPISLEALSHLIRTRLANQLRIGKEIKNAAIEVFLRENVWAIIEPDVQGFWICKTFYCNNGTEKQSVTIS